MNQDFLNDFTLTANMSGKFKGDKVTLLQGHLMQFLPLADIQIGRIREGVKNLQANKESLEVTTFIVQVVGDVRFFYETIYWIALAVESAAAGNKSVNPESPLGKLYDDVLKPLVSDLRIGRINLSHIHLDQLISAETAEKLEGNISKHLPEQEGFLYKLSIDPNGRSIKIGKIELDYEDDYIKLDNLKKQLA